VAVAQQLEQAIGCPIIQVIVTDREGLSIEIIRTLTWTSVHRPILT